MIVICHQQLCRHQPYPEFTIQPIINQPHAIIQCNLLELRHSSQLGANKVEALPKGNLKLNIMMVFMHTNR